MNTFQNRTHWKTLADTLWTRAETQPDQRVYTFLLDGELEEVHITYAELDWQARAIAAHLQDMGATGERALLLYPPGLDFIAAFFGCLYAGVVAVPTYPPRRKRPNPQLQAIVQDAQPHVVLTHTNYQFARESDEIPQLSQLKWLVTDQIDATLATEYTRPLLSADSLAFLQYTSGSTATPKGVMISNENLLHNLSVIQHGFEITADSIGVLWGPPYHDLGLISMLTVLYTGITAMLLDPIAMLQKPARWLQTISRYQGTISGGPNFAYDLCVDHIPADQLYELDLSSWELAFNGAEPIRAETLHRFANTFAACGFRPEAFYPCYGLGESVLIASGGLKAAEPIVKHLKRADLLENRVITAPPDKSTQAVVGCGYSRLGQKIRIVDPYARIPCSPEQVGEIWLAGESIAPGYWNRPKETADSFQAHLTGSNEGPYLRTGDLGFVQDGTLFITGRIKELLIFRGRNHYPQDIEATVAQSHPALQSNCGAAFSVELSGEERLVVVQEIKRTHRKSLQADEVVKAIRQAVSEQHELDVYAVALLKPGGVPKTTSGKIQRQLCREKFLNNSFSVIADDFLSGPIESNGRHQAERTMATRSNEAQLLIAKKQENPSATHNPDNPHFPPSPDNTQPSLKKQLTAVPAEQRQAYLLAVLQSLVAETFKRDVSHISQDDPLTSLGLSSLMAIRLMAQIEEELGIEVPATILLEGATINQLTQMLIARLPLESGATSGKVTAASVELFAQAPTETSPNLTPHEPVEKAIPPELYQFETFPEVQTFQHLYDNALVSDPYFKPHEQVNNNTAWIKGRELVNFSSYNYLGMSGDPAISQAGQAAIERYGTSVSANRLVSGEIPLHSDLETELAGLIGVESCMVYVGGHATNVTTIGHLLQPGDLILHDKLIHNSVMQGAALSGAKIRPFPHNDWAAVDAILATERHHFQRVLIVIEGVYSMDGDIPSLPRFIEVKQRHKALLMVDEAHSMGTIGPQGRGISDYFSVDPTQVDIWMGTLSKTFASCGGYIAGSQALVKYLKYTAPGFIYSVGMSPPNTGSALAAVRLLKAEPERVARLQQRANLFLTLTQAHGLDTGLSQNSPIIPIIVGDSYACSQLAESLFERGISVFPIVYPVVPENTARLRFFLSSIHTETQIRFAVDTVAEALAEPKRDIIRDS